MNNKLIMTALLGILTTSFSTQAALTLSATRYVYMSDTKAMPIKVTNHSDTPYGAQVWIESHAADGVVPFSVSPGVFTLKANKGSQTVQVAQLKTDANALAQDRESLFSVNLQEIPPKAKDELGNNVLVMASRTVVKLFYRPSELNDGREKAEEQIRISKKGNVLTFTNPTPYFFAVVSINGNEKLATEPFNRMAPFTQMSVEIKDIASNTVSFKAIDDFGGLRKYKCDVNKKQKQCQHVKTKS
ncbi:molecular chaperone [Vibrio owensii]|uniref:fimbrial biogenesis chaperone n=1 Tax=Vibrio owensii TaxID=696485 RepID=UPI00104E9F0F|nr:molecular chaperone [Vibrio owensii]TDE20588.1 molecular chaperone [Vibrio owensii]